MPAEITHEPEDLAAMAAYLAQFEDFYSGENAPYGHDPREDYAGTGQGFTDARAEIAAAESALNSRYGSVIEGIRFFLELSSLEEAIEMEPLELPANTTVQLRPPEVASV